jgi:hypothetical protein
MNEKQSQKQASGITKQPQPPSLDFKTYSPGRFAYLMETPFAKNLWAFLTDARNLRLMLSAAESGKPAISHLHQEIESRFGHDLASTDYRDDDAVVLVNNMIKQIMVKCGYEHIACGIFKDGNFIKSSGVYAKRNDEGETHRQSCASP